MYKYVIAALIFVIGWVCFTSCSTNKIQQDKYMTVASYDSKVGIYISKRVAYNLALLYTDLEKEYPLCLHGAVTDTAVYIKEVSFPTVISHTDTSTTYASKSDEDGKPYIAQCAARGKYLGTIHNHRYPNCTPSKTDQMSFLLSKYGIIETIACTKGDKILFYSETKDATRSSSSGQ